jgi:hypothetical protein
MESTMKPTSDWRSVIKVHPAADLFPMMGEDELKALADDIREHGLRTVPHTWLDKANKEWLIDGRNRLDALQMLGYRFSRSKRPGYGPKPYELRILEPDSKVTVPVGQFREGKADPYSVAVSFNINRRHLTTAQKSELAGQLLKADPTKSDRQIAEEVKVSDKTVGAKRKELEATAEIPQLEKRNGADGKARKLPTKSAAALQKSREPADEEEEKLQPLPEPLASMVEQYKKMDKDKLAEIAEAELTAGKIQALPDHELDTADYHLPAYLVPDVDRRTLPAYNFPEPSKKDQVAWIETYLSWPLETRLTMRQMLFNISDEEIPQAEEAE